MRRQKFSKADHATSATGGYTHGWEEMAQGEPVLCAGSNRQTDKQKSNYGNFSTPRNQPISGPPLHSSSKSINSFYPQIYCHSQKTLKVAHQVKITHKE